MCFRAIVSVAAGMAALCASPIARAWDATGHMQVADIAWSQLTPGAKRQVAAILKAGDPAFRPTSDADADVRDAFRRASTFADVIKGDRNTQYESIIADMNLTFFKTEKPNPANNEHALCKTWHYYDVPVRDKGKHTPEDSNALNALALAREKLAGLASSSSHDQKMECWWLYWIEHIVGDLHQPLHCVSSFEFFPEAGDAGGNRLTVTDPDRPDRPTRLHGYWDAGITHAIAKDRADGLPVTYDAITARWRADSSLAPSPADSANLNVEQWIKKGAATADSSVYDGLKQGGTLGADYLPKQITLSRKLAVLAGTRLAAILNGMLK